MIYKIFNISAKVTSILLIGVVILFLTGGEQIVSEITYKEVIMFIFFPIGLAASLIYAWFNPRRGGMLSIFCLLIFYLLEYFFKNEFPRGIYFALFAVPAILFFLGSFKDKSLRKN